MLLIDRKMPKSCFDCVCNDDNYRCNMTGYEFDYDIAWTGRMPNCPLSEEERKKGKWRRTPMACYGGGTITEYECSVCEEHQIITSNYCPNCGADMRGTQNGKK